MSVPVSPKLSVVINTLNEEHNLPYALRSVRSWTDEIVVVDMHSEDRTTETAREYGARVFFHERVSAFDAARAFAIAQATGEWILLLDADEVVPEPLSRRLLEIAANDEADVVIIPWSNYLLGAPLMHTGWGPKEDKHARFFKPGMLQSSAKIHDFSRPSPGARVMELAYQPGLAMVHFNYLDAAQFLEKLNRYTTIEARQAFERGERASAQRALYSAAREFVWRYLRMKGYRDGWRGLYLSGLMATYRWATYAKLQELESVGSREAVREVYGRKSERILEGYGKEVRREAGG
jgi:glycosyltransferase involved in cell wall biosynthesis